MPVKGNTSLVEVFHEFVNDGGSSGDTADLMNQDLLDPFLTGTSQNAMKTFTLISVCP